MTALSDRRLARRLGALAAIAAVLTAAVSWHLTVRADGTQEQQRLEATTAALTSARSRASSIERSAAQVRTVLEREQAAVAATQTAAAADHREAMALTAGTHELQAQQGANAVELLHSTDELTDLRALVRAVGGQIDDLRVCLGGVLGAASAMAADDERGAVQALRAVTGACARTQPGGGATGALFPYDFPDPYVVRAGGTYYGYATNSAGGDVQMIRSGDLRRWEWVGGALAKVPAWAKEGATWAPSVVQRDGRWLLYYAVRHGYTGQQCISVARAGQPAGPFVDGSSEPLVCDHDRGGSIDPSPFVGPDGQPYLLWKAEGETAGGDAELRAQALRADGLALQGRPSVLLRPAASWEGRTVEAPSMAATSAGLFLLYSANAWDRSSYAVGAAVCEGPLGPCRRQAGPLLASEGSVVGPGGAELFRDASGALRFAYHAWQPGAVGYPHSRYLRIGTVTTESGRLLLRG